MDGNHKDLYIRDTHQHTSSARLDKRVQLAAQPVTTEKRNTPKPWMVEEDNRLIERANSIWSSGMAKIDLVNAPSLALGGRTSESIRKRLSKLGWLPRSSGINEDLAVPEPIQTSPEPVSMKTPPMEEVNFSEEWKRGMLANAFARLEDPRLGATELKIIITDLLNGVKTKEEAIEAFEHHELHVFPVKWVSVPGRKTTRSKPKSNKQRRRFQYVNIQRLYRFYMAARTILDGHWREGYTSSNCMGEELEKYWVHILAAKGESEPVTWDSEVPVHWDILKQIGGSEVTEALRSMTSSAAVPDMVSEKELLLWHQDSLASLFNIILAIEAMPSTLSSARFTFVPKVEQLKSQDTGEKDAGES